jgi:hypothetical protein
MKELDKDRIKAGTHTSTGHQRYLCKPCETYFKKTERITCRHRNTIGRLLDDPAEHVEDLNDYLLPDFGLTPLECAALWTLIKKPEGSWASSHGSARPDGGDTRIYTGITHAGRVLSRFVFGGKMDARSDITVVYQRHRRYDSSSWQLKCRIRFCIIFARI